jgi:hypothetical protein
MALTGHLSDLSLSELIEFFCNQRKTGQLKVLYPQGPGYFYLQTGSVVDARIGVLRGIDAVYYALTLPNAKFEFSGSTESGERTINQPWTQVVLEGLRRLDEGIEPNEAFTDAYKAEDGYAESRDKTSDAGIDSSHVPAFMSSFLHNENSSRKKPFIIGAVAVAVLATVAVAGVPAGWYSRTKAVAAAASEQASVPAVQPEPATVETPAAPETTAVDTSASDAAALAAKKQREKERARARDEKGGAEAAIKNPGESSMPAPSDTAKAGPKKVTVTVTYDESGRVTQASGADATAVRIARQKRFPAGKAGSTTVTIPIN